MNSFKQYLNLFRLILLIVQIVFLKANDAVITFDPSSLNIVIGESHNVSIRLLKNFDKQIEIDFTYGDENSVTNHTEMIEFIPRVVFEPNNTEPKRIELKTLKKVGHLVIGALSNDIDIPLNDVIRLDIIHSKVIDVLISIIGWIYFFSWSISFYPQVILNFRTKDVSGLSLDFIALNFLGFFCYSVFNAALFWDKDIQDEYFHDHPRGVNPVLINDVLFALHALVLTFVTIVQCLVYKRLRHRVSYVTSSILIGLIGFLTVSGVVCGAKKLSKLDYIYFFSYVKLAITIMKYCPQAYLNFKRKSTIGWSIGNVLLDFTGGSFSLFQMFLLAYNYNDWTSIFGSPTKIGLGLLSIFFDLIFIFQHYVLYRHSSAAESDNYAPIS